MPRINSFSSLGPYLLYISGSAGLANGWISLSTNRYRGITGTFSNTSSSGQIITIGADANSSGTLANTARIINRHKSNGNIYWSVNYPANTWIYADRIAVERYETTSKDVPDFSQNVYVGLTHASSSSVTNDKVNIIRLTPTGTIGFQRQITDVSGEFSLTDIKADYFGVTFTEFQYILRLNTNGSTVYQKQYTVPSGHDLPTIRSCEAFDNVSWFTADSRQYSNTYYSQVFSLTSTGDVSWKNQYRISTLGRYLLSESMCVDTNKNVYLTGRENSINSSAISGHVIKLTNTGSLSWAKTFSNTTFSSIIYSKKDDAVYSLGRDIRNSTVGVIAKLYSNGEIAYVHTLQPGDGTALNLFPDREGYIYVANKDFVIKLKSDGSNLGINTANNVTYANVNSSDVIITDITSSITSDVSTATLTNSSLSITTPTTSLSTITFNDQIAPLEEGLVYGSESFTTPGTYTWVCPAGVTSVSAVCVGAGGAGAAGSFSTGRSGGKGGGGGLGWKNNITVIPGQSYTVQVGAVSAYDSGIRSGNSYFISSSTVAGLGGGSGASGGTTGGVGGGYVGDGGGNGGNGATGATDPTSPYEGTGSGGAGGYSGNGGAGTRGNITGGSGTGGAGGGGCGREVGTGGGGNGGGVGIFGQGSNGSGGTNASPEGKGGSGGQDGGITGAGGGLYGGGNNEGTGGGTTTGGSGAVRIIWPGKVRLFPSYNVGQE